MLIAYSIAQASLEFALCCYPAARITSLSYHTYLLAAAAAFQFHFLGMMAADNIKYVIFVCMKLVLLSTFLSFFLFFVLPFFLLAY